MFALEKGEQNKQTRKVFELESAFELRHEPVDLMIIEKRHKL